MELDGKLQMSKIFYTSIYNDDIIGRNIPKKYSILDLLSGNDKYRETEFTYNAGKFNLKEIYAREGDDDIFISKSFTSDVTFNITLIDMGTGNDNLSLFFYNYNIKQNLSFSLGEGDDEFTFKTGEGGYIGFKSLSINGGNGNDTLNCFYGTTQKSTYKSSRAILLDAGEGDDEILLGYKDSITGIINGGNDSDSFLLYCSNGALSGKLTFNGQDGDDSFWLKDVPANNNTTINGGSGLDIVYIGSDWEQRVVSSSVIGDTTKITYAGWQFNGITRETLLTFTGIETISYVDF
jgi:hypothetical protein